MTVHGLFSVRPMTAERSAVPDVCGNCRQEIPPTGRRLILGNTVYHDYCGPSPERSAEETGMDRVQRRINEQMMDSPHPQSITAYEAALAEAQAEIERLKATLAWTDEVYPSRIEAGGAGVEITWDEFNAMRVAAGFRPVKRIGDEEGRAGFNHPAMSDTPEFVTKLEAKVGKRKIIPCPWHCDDGMRGMDACNHCHKTGSGFRFNKKFYPNSERGWREAWNAAKSEFQP